jgi:hypothetical protein
MSMSRPLVLLTADDYAMTQGVSRAIEDLAARGLLSGTGAMVKGRHWPTHARRLAGLRDRVAVGLHLDLTLGVPLGPMPRLAPDGRLPQIGALTRAALLRRVDPGEIAAETARQLAAFETHLGFAPDIIDGHQHVHALPVVRDGVLAAVAERRYAPAPLIRAPTGSGGAKAALLGWLSAGFADAARAMGLMVNDSFGGVTAFAPQDAARDLVASLQAGPGRLHIAMCHPGFPDAELAAIDPVTVRRRAEYDALCALDGLADRIWHPRRVVGGATVDWSLELSGS